MSTERVWRIAFPGIRRLVDEPRTSDREGPVGPRRVVRSRLPFVVREGIGVVESTVYLVAGLLLVLAAGLIITGTITDVLQPEDRRSTVDTGVLVLDRILLAFIIAELLFTLRLTLYRGEILAEPFLFIGLIAVVRRVLVITAEAERSSAGGRALTNFLLELGVLAAMALALAIAIHLLRRTPTEARLERGQ